MEPEPPKTQLVVVLPVSEKGFIVEAAKESGAASMSAFIRDAVLEKSRLVLDRDLASRVPPRIGAVPVPPSLLHVHIGARPSPDAPAPATVFPSLRSFGTNLSDRNRALLRWIGANEAASLHELARRFDYPYGGLLRALRNLEGFGLIGFAPIDAQRIAPYLLCTGLRLELPLRENDGAEGRIFRAVLGAPPGASPAHLTCTSMKDFSDALTDRGYQLLRLIDSRNPPTIAALAKLTGKTTQNTYSLLRRHAGLGLVGIEKDGARKKPVLRYDTISLEIDLSA